MGNYAKEQGTGRLTTYWKAHATASGEDYSGAEINHNATGLTLGFARDGVLASTAVTAGSPAPADLADNAAAQADWGWCRVMGPFYRADFPASIIASGVEKALLGVWGVSGVTFTQVSLADIFGSNPRAASVTTGSLRDDSLDLIGDMINAAGSLTFKDSQGNNYVISVTRAARQAIATTTNP